MSQAPMRESEEPIEQAAVSVAAFVVLGLTILSYACCAAAGIGLFWLLVQRGLF